MLEKECDKMLIFLRNHRLAKEHEWTYYDLKPVFIHWEEYTFNKVLLILFREGFIENVSGEDAPPGPGVFHSFRISEKGMEFCNTDSIQGRAERRLESQPIPFTILTKGGKKWKLVLLLIVTALLLSFAGLYLSGKWSYLYTFFRKQLQSIWN